MTKPSNRKPRGNCRLKTLPSNRQEELYEFMDGLGDGPGHTYAECVTWLEAQGVETNPSQLCKWRQWYIMRLRMQWSENMTEAIMLEEKKHGEEYSDEQIQRTGNRFFSLLAINTCDDKAWARSQTAFVRRQRLTFLERKMEFEVRKYEEQRAEKKATDSEPKLTPEEKEKRFRQIMGTE